MTISLGSIWASQVVKNPPANAGDARDVGSTPGLGRPPGVGNGNLIQYSCLENSMDRGAWWAIVHGVAKSQTQLSARTHKHTHTHTQTQSRFNIRSNSGPCIRVHIEEIHLGYHLTQSQKTWVLSVLLISQSHAQHYGEAWA